MEIVDIDQTGLIANGKNFELAQKSAFPDYSRRPYFQAG